MNTYYRNLFTIFGISLALCIVTFLVFIRAERINRYKAVIPEKLKINGVVLQGEDNTPLIYVLLLPIRPFSCGGGVFKLSQSTIDASKSEGLDFLKTQLNLEKENTLILHGKKLQFLILGLMMELGQD